MNNILANIGYRLTLIRWAVVLHVRRWSRYRIDVALWIGTIWLTLIAQGTFVFSAYTIAEGSFFGYSFEDIVSFFGITLISTGLAQIVVHGLIIRVAHVVWRGDFDFWLLQPPAFFYRVLLEDIGLIWFWPHLVAGVSMLLWALPSSLWLLGITVSVLSALVEIGITTAICIPCIKWGRWNPEDGLWEYFERSRSIPLGRTKPSILWLVSFGVVHYSIALEILTGGLSVVYLALFALASIGLAYGLGVYFLRQYASASS